MINSFLTRELPPHQFYFVETQTNFGERVTSEEGCANIEEVRAHLENQGYPQWVVDSAIKNLGLDTDGWKIKISILTENSFAQVDAKESNKKRNLVTQEKVVGFKPVDRAVIPLMTDSYNDGQSPQVFVSLFGYLNNDGLIDRVEVNAKYALRPYDSDPSEIVINDDSLIVSLQPFFEYIEAKNIEGLKAYLAQKKQSVEVQFQHAILEWVNDQDLLDDSELEVFEEWRETLKTTKDYTTGLEEPESLADDCNSVNASQRIAEYCAYVLNQWLVNTIQM